MNKDLTTLFTGRHATILAEVDSTNTYLARMLRTVKLPEGAVIRAIKQNAGRGQGSGSWISEEGKNLLLSFVFYPFFIVSREVFLLNKTYALAMHDLVSMWLGDGCAIKWPNDIYWQNKKIGGLLVENSINSASISYSILGVGLNINQLNFPDQLPNPSSFAIIKNYEFNLDEVFNSLCSAVEARYLQLKSGDKEGIENDYMNALYRKVEWSDFKSAGHTFSGRIISVDENGKLLIETRAGSIRTFETKEVVFL